ncbi:hypothetical protein SCUCBS95973_004071 [Sporothrix curviconia]|uniref:Adenine DNA glycosylase n=1 Tax=Sporothrix curviconia TaxID=1260050 RepID=A0ABP0BKM4_9PEZI
MARSVRASAAAAARKIHVQAEDHDDAEELVPRGRAQPTTAARSRRSASNKRKRVEESPEYEDEAADGESGGDEDDEEAGEGDDDESFDAKKVNRRASSTAAKNGAPNKTTTTAPAAKMASMGPPPAKKRKPPQKSSTQGFALERLLFGPAGQSAATDKQIPPACCPPERTHTIEYHRPLLLDGDAGRRARRALLAWYDGVQATRGMPWRRDVWLHPDAGLADDAAEEIRNELARRAYEVWMSEVMAQQTRIPVVIAYWTRWMARWPTLPDLAAAAEHEVFQEWSGLGYYSRASRVHEAAKLVAADPVFRGLLPPDAATLEARVPGVGRYTAGAISAIVYGRPAAMVDGNVIRVLSRQLGMFADSKAEKELVDLLWAAAEALVQTVARDGDDKMGGDAESAPISDRPGRWGQALMELGSTVCAPKPDCAACPISSTCRVFAEGLLLHEREKKPADLPRAGDADDEKGDTCDLCEQFPELDEEEAAALAKAAKRDKAKEAKEKKGAKDTKKAARVTTSPFFDVEDAAAGLMLSDDVLATIVGHARTFPLRRPKKPVREVETLVCAVRVAAKGKKGDGSLYLLHQRPAKGLLASLWQLPSYDMPSAVDGAAARQKEAEAFVARWLAEDGDGPGKKKKETGKPATRMALKTTSARHLGSIPWLFSHLKQTMHVYLFDMAAGNDTCSAAAVLPTPASCCWASVVEADKTYTMGTGMRKCWDLVKSV